MTIHLLLMILAISCFFLAAIGVVPPPGGNLIVPACASGRLQRL